MRPYRQSIAKPAVILTFVLWACTFRAGELPAVEPLALAHAHNDYLHARPLLDALDHGFTSVEADIFLVDNKLLVAHTERELKPDRTLESLYLDPLRERVRVASGTVYPQGGSFYLLIDIKSAAEPTYAVLTKVLSQYSDMISLVRDGKLEPKAVNVVVSGNRPHAMMAAEPERYAGIDGRWSDLDSELPSHLLPLISDNWSLHFTWKGEGQISEAEQQKLANAVNKAHTQGRRIRFWATPDTVAMWRVLRSTGADMINTDDLPGLEQFLRDKVEE